MVLHFYLDLPLTEAAEILDIPAGTAKSRLHRGLETFARPWRRATRALSARSGALGMTAPACARALDRRLDGR